MVYVLLGTGFEEVEAIAPIDLLRRAGISVLTVGVEGKTVTGSHGIPVVADIEIGQMDLTDLDMIVLPGGLGGVATVRKSEAALEALRFAWENGKYVADLGITNGRTATCYPGCESGMGSANTVSDVPCVVDGKLITGASAGCAVPFALALIETLKGSEEAQKIARRIVIR